MQGFHGPVLGKEAGQFLVEGHGLPLCPRLFVSLMHTLILDLHPLSLGTTLLSIPFVVPYLYLLRNALEDIPLPVPFLELMLDLLLIPDVNEISRLPIVPVV